MKNFVQPGNVLTMIAPAGGVVSGGAYMIGSIFGVANGDAAATKEFEMSVNGVYELPKVSTEVWARGDRIYWDNTAAKLTKVATGNVFVGVATEAAANPTDNGTVRLNDAAAGELKVKMAAAAGAANVTEVTITVVDGAGNTVAGVNHLDVWLSDDADGEGLTGTTASGTVQAKAASGTVLSAMVAKKALRVQTLKTGVFVLEITDTAKTAFKVAANIAGKTAVGLTLATGNYG
jgi:predicted RecA/RadA family phage recombinase